MGVVYFFLTLVIFVLEFFYIISYVFSLRSLARKMIFFLNSEKTDNEKFGYICLNQKALTKVNLLNFS